MMLQRDATCPHLHTPKYKAMGCYGCIFWGFGDLLQGDFDFLVPFGSPDNFKVLDWMCVRFLGRSLSLRFS